MAQTSALSDDKAKDKKKANLPKELLDVVYIFPKKDGELRQCGLCKLELTSNVVANSHYAGHKHKMAVNSWLRVNGHEHLIEGGTPVTPVAVATTTTTTKPKKKKNKKRKADGDLDFDEICGPSSSLGENVSKKAKKDSGGFCTVCDIHLSSDAVAKDHFQGKKHKKKFLESRRDGNFEPGSFGIGEMFKPF